MPNVYSDYLVFIENDDNYWAEVAHYHADLKKFFHMTDAEEIENVTHWMELPRFPND
jgi:hypothetical protein